MRATTASGVSPSFSMGIWCTADIGFPRSSGRNEIPHRTVCPRTNDTLHQVALNPAAGRGLAPGPAAIVMVFRHIELSRRALPNVLMPRGPRAGQM
jgi:hypothetical protein